MLEKFNKFLNSSIVLSVLMFILGLIFMIYPSVSFSVVTYIIAIFLILNGLYFIIEKETSLFFSSFLTLGIIELLLGVVMLLNPDIMKTLFPIVAGIVMVTKATLDLRLSLLLKKYEYDTWLSIFICSLIAIISGIIIIINPSIGTMALTVSLGLLITINSISSIVDTIIFKKNIKEISKLLEK